MTVQPTESSSVATAATDVDARGGGGGVRDQPQPLPAARTSPESIGRSGAPSAELALRAADQEAAGEAGRPPPSGVEFDRRLARQQLAEGLRYLNGDGVPVDYGRARRALETAAWYEGRAAYLLYDIYGNGLGVTPDIDVSFRWLERSARMGFAEAQYALARFYYEGSGDFLSPDTVVGAFWMRAAAKQGYPFAQAYLIERGLKR